MDDLQEVVSNASLMDVMHGDNKAAQVPFVLPDAATLSAQIEQERQSTTLEQLLEQPLHLGSHAHRVPGPWANPPLIVNLSGHSALAPALLDI